MVKITFPDGSVREYEQGVTGLQIAESISPALARNVVSCGVNGETVELNRPINEDANVELYKFEDEQGKHTFWHTSAHLLAEALQELYPGIQFGFGPAVESGFFYDVMPAEGQVISENDFAKIEAKMLELAKKNEPVVRKEVAKADALAEFKADGQNYKCEHIEQDLEDGTITTYTQGNFTDLCRGPHLMNTGLIKAVKITSVAGAFWRGDAKREQMTRIYGISFPKKKMLDEYLVVLEEAKKRDCFGLCITPEGTRSLNPEWKKGFYFIALKAGIPILLYGVDYEKKVIQCTKMIIPSGDVEKDMREIKLYFKDFKGKKPEKFSIGNID